MDKTENKPEINLSDETRLIIKHNKLKGKQPVYEKFYLIFYKELENKRLFSVMFDEERNILVFEVDSKTLVPIKPISELDQEIHQIIEKEIRGFFKDHYFTFEGQRIFPEIFFNNFDPISEFDDIINFLRDDEVISLPIWLQK
ncbi:hypothetical protein [Mesomycoplasma hyopneumoniae]|uniref:Uncharacterized protein n=1 Tax=Mesomycoplasma hyopneumoniae (strain 7448) TaxID=262722 RepID=Q4A8G2_MESH7|nr:hypothetical protein [Mesomycoplasma hyopneumoniae]AAZ53577.1 hypothetical protein MHP7448_0203 [Mesomycoplasma hyopneumoniae 7448]AGQ50833.1 hypothetical protein MHL_0733 [Mesomycoplasma hyopneumoniae 7422]MXR10169.1 hypothetical protein [Mesomycoplasma hyopneumoniae]MXR34457.1 hypothetical protein [Mesomycoplasma hyopneumoniae]